MMKINRAEKKSNMEMLNMVNKPRQIIKTINIRKIKFFGYIMRYRTYIINSIEGKKEEKDDRGKQIWGV